MEASSHKCPRCFGRAAWCLCALVRRVVTRTRFIVLRHALERSKQSNTARVAALALTNCEVREYGLKREPLRTDDLRAPNTWLLFPGHEDSPLPGPPPDRLVVIDGSWSQARRMVQRIEALRGMPRLSLPTGAESPARLRTAPPGGMSTLEAIARAVERLEGSELAEPLDLLNRAMIERVLESRGYV